MFALQSNMIASSLVSGGNAWVVFVFLTINRPLVWPITFLNSYCREIVGMSRCIFNMHVFNTCVQQGIVVHAASLMHAVVTCYDEVPKMSSST